jgi:nicotinate-nucleotide pyrophosphorylase (carboxylating)
MTLPFNVALSGERVALNLLQHACAIATQTHRFVAKAKAKNIAILDTRKTTPGLRWLEKYAVICGGGQNHRWCQTDMWMIKDNHKAVFGGVGAAAQFFKQLGSFYNPVLLEVHSLPELQEGLELGLRHFMLDNFGPQDIAHAVAMKRPGVTFEISGGVTLENIDLYLQSGIDAISLGSLTQGVPRVDISFKLENAK